MQMRKVGYVNFENHCKKFLRELQWISMISNTKHLGGEVNENKLYMQSVSSESFLLLCLNSNLYTVCSI